MRNIFSLLATKVAASFGFLGMHKAKANPASSVKINISTNGVGDFDRGFMKAAERHSAAKSVSGDAPRHVVSHDHRAAVKDARRANQRRIQNRKRGRLHRAWHAHAHEAVRYVYKGNNPLTETYGYFAKAA